MVKRGTALLLALLLALLCAVTAGAEVPTKTKEAVAASSTTFSGGGGKTSSAAAKGYINQIMRGKEASNAVRDFGGRLTGPEKKLYDAVLPEIKKVAAGEREDTVFSFKISDLVDKISFTAEELGVPTLVQDNAFAPGVEEKFKARVNIDFMAVNSALLQDCPYELYWYDKADSGAVSVPHHIASDGNTVYWPDDDEHRYTFSLKVAQGYQKNGNVYKVNPSFATAAKNAAANARAIISKHSGETDPVKLKSYLTEICNLVSYNDEAAAGGVPFGDPWQMVWVFDGDKSTKVVCEGYAKAFQFLCDNSVFKGNISAICVLGTMNGGTGAGKHMWNVVRMADKKNYLVDVTNCDEGTVGAPDLLFLVPYSSGNADDGYVYMAGSKAITYKYSDDFKTNSLASDRDMSGTPYDDSKATDPAPTTPAPATTAPVTTTPSTSAPTTKAPSTKTPAPTAKLPAKVTDQTGSYSIKNGKATFLKPAKSAAKMTVPDVITVQKQKVPVVAVGNKAFANNAKLVQITLGKNVTVLGSDAFKGCVKLTAVKGGAALKTISEDAFNGARALKTFPVLKSLQSIGNSAFQNCASLTEFTLGPKVTGIGKSAFAGCVKLTAVKGGAALKTIGKTAFAGDKALKTFPVLKSLESIGNSAFKGCASLTEFTLGPKVTVIGGNAFDGCAKLTAVKGGASVKTIGDDAFGGVKALKTFPVLPKLEDIGDTAFKGCASLTEFTLGPKVSAIGKNAFYGCSKLNKIIVKTGLLTEKNVKAGAFQKIAPKAVFDCAKAKIKAYEKLFRARGAKDCKVK